MKKILVLSLLGACCLNDNVCALDVGGINLALRRTPVSILVQKNYNSRLIPIPLMALEAKSYFSVNLKGLDETNTKVAFALLHRSKEGTQQDMSVDPTYSDLTPAKLDNLICSDPQNLTIEDCEINEADIPVLIEALKKHQSLGKFELLERADQKISDKGLLDLYDALIKLPALMIASQIPDRPGLHDVYTALQDLTTARVYMLCVAINYFKYRVPPQRLATRYAEARGLVQSQIMRVQAAIAAARARLPQE